MTEPPSISEVNPRKMSLSKALNSIEEGELVLPAFQRNFAWSTGKVSKLLESMLNGFYINTLLTIEIIKNEDNNVPFEPQGLLGGPDPEVNPSAKYEMVLDGQQRLTSLYYALTAPDEPLQNTKYPKIFYIDFNRILEDEIDEDTIGWDSPNNFPNDFQTNCTIQVELGKIPFTVFREDFSGWRRNMEDLSRDSGELSQNDVRKFEDLTEAFRKYEMQLIQMEKGTPASAVVQTFERINTTGLALTVFDILTARLYPHKIRLKELWKWTLSNSDAIERHRELSNNNLQTTLLKIIALYRNKQVKDKSLRELAANDFESDWEQATEMLERALQKSKSIGRGGFGVINKYGFPYSSMLPALSILLYHAESEPSAPNPERLSKLQQWYWSNVFSGRYVEGTNSKIYQDYRDMKKWMGNETEKPSALMQTAREIPTNFELDRLTQGGAYQGVMGLLVLNDAQDFNSFESISVHEADDHHIFPKSKLKNGDLGTEYEQSERNTVLNRTLIEYRGNRFEYEDELPSTYLPKMIESHSDGREGVIELLKTHFIDQKAFDSMLDDNYETFRRQRKDNIRSQIESRIHSEIDWGVDIENRV